MSKSTDATAGAAKYEDKSLYFCLQIYIIKYILFIIIIPFN